MKRPSEAIKTLQKTPSGIPGLDQITDGGLPQGRATLVCGGPGSGKTLFGLQFLLQGALEYGEPGVCITFEENEEDIAANLTSLGYNVAAMIKQKKLAMDYISVNRRQIEETGDYDLEGLFVRLDHAIRQIGAKRVMLDTMEYLLSGLRNDAIVRSEFRRLFRWLKDRGVTAVVTAEGGVKTLTRWGLEEYVADCVISLDHRVTEQISTRRLRVVKYRGSPHGTNEYPFLLDERGISVLPITSLGLRHQAGKERVISGIPGLDAMLDGDGFYRGSSILVTGTAGTGKSSFGAHFAKAACDRGERALLFAFEESPSQISRNMQSIGLNIEPALKKGLLTINSVRPTALGLEAHLTAMHRTIEEVKPNVVVVDPITNLIAAGNVVEVKSMLTRLIDYLKIEQITAMFTNLTFSGMEEQTAVGISSLMDCWIMLTDVDTSDGDRQRIIRVLKARGMSHSTKALRFIINNRGLHIFDPTGAELGSARTLKAGRNGKS